MKIFLNILAIIFNFFIKKEIESCDYLPGRNDIFLIGTDFLYAEIGNFFNGKAKIVYSEGRYKYKLFSNISRLTSFIGESDFGWEINKKEMYF